MISKEEVTLIIGLIGLEGGFFNHRIYTAVMIVVIVITLDTPLLLKVIFGVRNPLSHTKKADIPFYMLVSLWTSIKQKPFGMHVRISLINSIRLFLKQLWKSCLKED